jgi:hypothetical protein
MTTDAQMIAWLKNDSAIRCVLMEVVVLTSGVETTRYISNRGYVTSPSETPPNQAYIPLIASGVKFTESLSIDGTPSLSYGSIEFDNYTGEIDSWLEDVWVNRTVKIYLGDMTWGRSQFYKIFDGITATNAAPSRDKLSITLSDKMLRLNTTMSEVKLGGTSPNVDKLIPLLFGECHNITPLLVNSALEKYQVHNGPIESIIEVRDNGIPVSFTADILTGTFVLNQAVVGTITCSAQGDKPSLYSNNAVTIIKRIVKDYGNVLQKLVDADIDLTSFTSFAAANVAPVGIYLTEKANVIDIVNKLSSSIGARVAMSRQGLLYLVKVDLQGVTGGTAVTSADMVQWSINVAELPTVVAAVKLGYCKNYTVQANLQTGLPTAHIDLFALDWLSVTQINTTTSTNYKMFVDPVMQESELLTTADANVEATRRLVLLGTQRKVIRYQGLAYLMLEVLGGIQTIQHPRFGLAAGISGQIISLTTDWLNPRVDINVLL